MIAQQLICTPPVIAQVVVFCASHRCRQGADIGQSPANGKRFCYYPRLFDFATWLLDSALPGDNH